MPDASGGYFGLVFAMPPPLDFPRFLFKHIYLQLDNNCKGTIIIKSFNLLNDIFANRTCDGCNG